MMGNSFSTAYLRINVENQDAAKTQIRTRALARTGIVRKLKNRNLYRITVRDKDGRISDHEIQAPSLHLVVQDQDEHSETVSVERIHPSTGEVLGGFYNE